MVTYFNLTGIVINALILLQYINLFLTTPNFMLYFYNYFTHIL